MTYADSTPDEIPPKKRTRPTTSAALSEWSLTQHAFDKLLGALASDREEAARKYELLRQKLIRFCEANTKLSAEDRVDEIINRVTRRIDEGEQVTNVFAYSYGVARMVIKEFWKEQERTRSVSDSLPTVAEPKITETNEGDRRLVCFDQCLEGLSPQNRKLILGYYQGERRLKIERRKELAEQLSIPLNALRIRAHRVRKTLEDCVGECVTRAA